MLSEHGIAVATFIFRLSHNSFCKRALHIYKCSLSIFLLHCTVVKYQMLMGSILTLKYRITDDLPPLVST